MSLSPIPVFAEGLTKAPVPLVTILGLQVTNSMVAAAIAAIVIIAVVQVAMRAPKLVPSGLQNFVEWIVELMSNFLELIMGRETMKRGFWFFGGLFVFIFAGNVLALVPGVGTFGYGHGTTIWNFEVDRPFLRGANANDSLTAAYTAVFFFMWFYWCFSALGFREFFVHIFGSKVQFPNRIINSIFVLIFFLVGVIEILTIIVIRPIAFTFRLYGNIFGGESFLDTIFRTAPNFFWACVFLVPGYLWEFVVAFVQAFVFFILTAVFTGILTNTSSHSAEAHKAH